jgi:RHS repeat-associated protein
MLQPGRSYNSGGYRYGFNGKENDNEVKGEGNQQDYGARIYDSRIGRWLSLDPLMKNTPALSPYNAFENSPLTLGDPDGKDAIVRVVEVNGKRTLIITANYHYIEGTVDAKVLDAVKAGFGSTFKKIDYEGQKVNVKFDITFTAEKADVNIFNLYQPEAGQNVLINTDNVPLPASPNARDASTYRQVAFSGTLMKNDFSVSDDKGNKYELSDEDKISYTAQYIMHGIGHNIGMTHGEKSEGLMKRYPLSRNLGDKDAMGNPTGKGTQYTIVTYSLNSNIVQALVDRIPGMTALKGKFVDSILPVKAHKYWEGKTEENKDAKDPEKGSKESVGASGVSVIQN